LGVILARASGGLFIEDITMRFSWRYLLHLLIIFSVLSSCTAKKERVEESGTAMTNDAAVESNRTSTLPAAASKRVIADFVSLYMDSLDVKEAGLRVIYPIESENKAEGKRPSRSSEPNRGGSFEAFQFNFYFPQKMITFQEILFHSVASCSSFKKNLIKNEDFDYDGDGEGFSEDLYSPKNFVEQKAAFENRSSFGKYEFIKLREESYLIACWHSEPAGLYVFEAMTFKGDTRIIIAMTGRKKCEDDYQNYLNLLSRFKLLPLNN
jgi:hypothetical protein